MILVSEMYNIYLT